MNLCRVCMIEKYGTNYRYTYKDLEVHHIVPIKEDYSKRLDSENLITLCRMHHEMAEKGEIGREELKRLIKQSPWGIREKNNNFSRPTVHPKTHNFKFSVSFLENHKY